MFEGHPFRDAPVRKLPSAQIKPRISRRARFAAYAVMAAFWCTICGVLLTTAVHSRDVLFIGFMVLFVVPGLVFLGYAVHAFLGLFNPVVEIFVDEDRPALGESLELRWRLVGKAARVRRLQIDLEGVEEATYTRGTDTITDRERFMTLAITSTVEAAEIVDGTAVIEIPRGAVPSFTAKNNKIIWRLVVRGVIPNWPDIHDEMLLDVVADRRVRVSKAAA